MTTVLSSLERTRRPTSLSEAERTISHACQYTLTHLEVNKLGVEIRVKQNQNQEREKNEETISSVGNDFDASNDAPRNYENPVGKKLPASSALHSDPMCCRPLAPMARALALPSLPRASPATASPFPPRARLDLPRALTWPQIAWPPRPRIIQPPICKHESSPAAIVKLQARQDRAGQGCSCRPHYPI